jgi:15-cis-phytoene desaturase
MSARNIDEVIDGLDAVIAGAITTGDRIGYFAALYRRVTVEVRKGIRSGAFLDADRMNRLDTRFANRYLDAVEAYRAGRSVSESWKISLDACKEHEPTILQHLYSGLSAHLLLDLSVATAETCPGPRIADIRGDFDHISQIVGGLMREVDAVIGQVSPWIGLLDRMAGIEYASVNKIGISVARDLAWRAAVELAPLDDNGRALVTARLDGRAALVARNIVKPWGGLHLVARLIRTRESDDVPRIIKALGGITPSPAPSPFPPGVAKRVAILGGGIGGMTAAHELVERGFEVDVYESKNEPGGKACSQLIAGTGTGGRKDLPGEHGFRFFPSFYRHVIDTMGRIPVTDGGVAGTVAGRIKPSDEMGMEEKGAGFVFERHAPRNIGDFFQVSRTIEQFFSKTNVREADVARFSHAMLRFMVSCDDRRLGEYERMTFWDFVGGNQCDPSFQKYIYTTRFMVAMDPKNGSARTVASKGLCILADFFRNGTRTDGVLDGPTTERWLKPWQDELTRRGVRFHLGSPVEELLLAGNRLSGARVAGQTVTANHYVLALPLDRAQALISDPLAAADPALAGVRRLTNAMSSMVGAQFFFSRPVPVCRGHVAYPDAPWALSSVSQGQFWHGGVTGYGAGDVVDILSVDISDWYTIAPRLGKAAVDCSATEVLDEVWAQLVDALGDRIDTASLVHRHLDRNVEFTAGQPMHNTTPLLVHPPGSYFDRPGADVGIENLFLASDYVKTNTDLASMEGANEAARRAVNAILDAEGSAREPCQIYSMADDVGTLVTVAKRLDRDLYLLETGTPKELSFGGALGTLRGQTPPDNMRVMKEIEDALVGTLEKIGLR